MKIKVRQLWTPGMDQPDGPYLLTISNGLIEEVTRLDAAESDTADLDIDATAIPGLIDCHEHIGIDVGDERAQSFEEASRMLLLGVRNLRTIVDHGVTTIRDCGERADVEPYWMEALQRGWLVGPRVIRSGSPICRTGGHAWYLGEQADGADMIRAAVRRRIRDGADFIKVMITGGLGTVGSDPRRPEYTSEEVSALIAEAHRLGRKVAGHAHGGPGVDAALAAGIDSIEHGALLTSHQLRQMAEQGTVLVSTQAIGVAFERDANVPPAVKAKMSGFVDTNRQVVREAHRLGVPVAVGCDCVHGRVDEEISHLVECGFSPLEGLVAATQVAADLIGDSSIGALTEGKSADILFVNGDPIQDPTRLAEIVGVVSKGHWVVQPTA